MSFEPIAIIGRACLLPGAQEPEQLWRAICDNTDLLSPVDPDRWGLPRRDVITAAPPDAEPERTWCDRGGYVRGFEQRFDPTGFALEAEEINRLDPLVQWLLHTARQALRNALVEDTRRTGAIVGNLSFPSESMSHYAARQWLGDELADAAGLPRVDPQNRFTSGLPAHLIARALGLGDTAYCLDAACASSLVALKLACDRLQDRQADVMLAGAVSRADDLFIHVGFCALQALSPSGQSRPFHRDADGLLPAEGAGMVVLERLADAERKGRHIYGVIRGIGMSNDGRGQGLLAPNADGQVRAMQQAYQLAGLNPSSIDYVECHATGTPAGDQCELRSMARVFTERDSERKLPIGSLKGHMGHLITAAGVAGLIKLLSAFAEQRLPPTMPLEGKAHTLFSELPFRVVENAETWLVRDRDTPRRAGLSAFGFGGNNAHVILEEYRPASGTAAASKADVASAIDVAIVTEVASERGTNGAAHVTQFDSPAATMSDDIAVVALSQRVLQPTEAITLPLTRLRFPPSDLRAALPQQLLMLSVADEVLAQRPQWPTPTMGVFIGMGCDPNVARYGARWRLPGWARSWGIAGDADFMAAARSSFTSPLQAAGVLGTMPNIVANRINSSFDLRGPSMTLSAEELSGVRALQLACRSLRVREIDAALVGAVDCSREPVHMAALRALGRESVGADAAVALIVMRLADARQAGHPVLATLPSESAPEQRVSSPERQAHGAHAASGLLQLVDAMRAGARGCMTLHALGGQQAQITIMPGDTHTALSTTVAQEEAAQDAVHGATQHTLPFTGQLAPPQLGPLPQHSSDPRPSLQQDKHGLPRSMARAPRLEPVIQRESLNPQQPLASQPQRTPQSSAAIGAGSLAPLLTAAMAQRTRLAKLHEQFLSQQSAIHRQFIESRTRQQRQWLDHLAHMEQTGVSHSLVSLQSQAAAHPHVSSPSQVALQSQGVRPSLHARIDAPAPASSTTNTASPPPAAASVSSLSPATKQATPLPGFSLDRDQLMVHAGGAISEIFGAEFAEQDGFARQVRMPLPPLLLADRMTGIDAQPNALETGTIWTETDVRADAWYLYRGRMPAGLMIESGQADLMLISYMGIDHLNRSERVYRLLGCELTYHGPLPQPGETLCYEIHIDGHAQQGDVRLFFFHYDCHIDGQLRLSVRHGQAGFFSDEELAGSAGVLWDPATVEPCPAPRLEIPEGVTARRAFSAEQVRAFAAGRAFECFGDGFEKTCTHTRTPAIAAGRMLFIDEVSHFDPRGGPWGRGYLRAVDTIEPDDWFFEGHFLNDPCMPGTLMFEGCLQTMAFYLAALGFSCDRDGWRFEPVASEKYQMRCRGQVLPSSKKLVYEVFVEEVVGGPQPTLYADLLCTVDGRKAFHCKRMALRMIPDWPLREILARRPELLSRRPGRVAGYDGFAFDHTSLLACAWGAPTQAFGPIYARFDSPRTVARLPGPPYHFMTRVAHADGRPGQLEPRQRCVVEYDVPPDAWYFKENGAAVMPFCVLLEAALQPCGWLASYVGSALSSERDLAFRNLDGTGTLHHELVPDCGALTTSATITSISSSAGMIIESFEVECRQGDVLVYDMKTVFGFFPHEALENQSGLPIPAHEEGALDAPSERSIDLRARPARYCTQSAKLSSAFLLMIDRVTGIWPEGGEAGLGRYRAEKDIDPEEWFLKAHFFQDPVQPGSLGIEAMIQLLQFAMLDRGMDEGLSQPRFESLALGSPLTWKYRGQVRVHNRRVHTLIELTDTGQDERGRYACANASLYVDGMRIYEARNLSMCIVSGAAPEGVAIKGGSAANDAHVGAGAMLRETLDPERDHWLRDHCPTFTIAALPMMSMIDRLATAAQAQQSEQRVVGLDAVQVERWLPVAQPVELRCSAESDGAGWWCAELSAWRQARRAELSRFEPVARGCVELADAYPPPDACMLGLPEPLRDARAIPSPYASGQLFHGPAFHKLISARVGSNGASTILDAAAGEVPAGLLNQVLLDAATHGIPHDRLSQWSAAISDEVVGYPHRIDSMQLFGATPRQGMVRCEARLDGFDENLRCVRIRLYLFVDEALWMSCRLTEILMPKGPLGMVAPEKRCAFLRDRLPQPEMALSRLSDGETRLCQAEVKASNWLPGTIEALYRVNAHLDMVQQIAVKDHIAQARQVHPSEVEPSANGARLRSQPLWYQPLDIDQQGDDVCVRDAGLARLDLQPVIAYWSQHFDIGRWPVEDLYYGLIERFVRRVEIQDPAAFEAVCGRSVLYLANHQVAIESLLFSIIASGLSRVPTVTLAKAEHRGTWLGLLIQHCFSYPDVMDPQVITYFDRGDPASLSRIIGELAQAMMGPGKSVMVHIEGTRSLSCSQPVMKMTSAFIDMALHTRAAIVPVRFTGGLPREPLAERIEFPIGMGRQDIHIGTPIEPETFEALPYKERKAVVINAINALGPPNTREQPLPGDASFAAVVRAHQQDSGVREEHAALWQVLKERRDPEPSVQRLLRATKEGRLELADTPADRWLGELARRLLGARVAIIEPS